MISFIRQLHNFFFSSLFYHRTKQPRDRSLCIFMLMFVRCTIFYFVFFILFQFWCSFFHRLIERERARVRRRLSSCSPIHNAWLSFFVEIIYILLDHYEFSHLFDGFYRRCMHKHKDGRCFGCIRLFHILILLLFEHLILIWFRITFRETHKIRNFKILNSRHGTIACTP